MGKIVFIFIAVAATSSYVAFTHLKAKSVPSSEETIELAKSLHPVNAKEPESLSYAIDKALAQNPSPVQKNSTQENLLEANLGVFQFPNTPVGKKLKDHMLISVQSGPKAEEEYQKSLSELRKNAAPVIKALDETYKNIPIHASHERWLTVETIREVGTENAYEPLKTIASSDLPREIADSEPMHGYDPKAQELKIRATALEGIGQIAKQGNKEAEEFLYVNAVSQNEITLKRAAIRGYLSSADPADYERRVGQLNSRLDPAYHDLVNLNSTSAQEILHIANASQELSEKNDEQQPIGSE